MYNLVDARLAVFPRLLKLSGRLDLLLSQVGWFTAPLLAVVFVVTEYACSLPKRRVFPLTPATFWNTGFFLQVVLQGKENDGEELDMHVPVTEFVDDEESDSDGSEGSKDEDENEKDWEMQAEDEDDDSDDAMALENGTL
jgi:hypothetical protein